MLEADEEVEILISQLQVENFCTVNGLPLTDDDLAICADISDDQWDENFLAEIGPSSKFHIIKTVETSNLESDSDEESTSLRCRNLCEANTVVLLA